MLSKDHFEQIVNLFGSHDTTETIGQFISERYGLFVDSRSTPNHALHGSGNSLMAQAIFAVMSIYSATLSSTSGMAGSTLGYWTAKAYAGTTISDNFCEVLPHKVIKTTWKRPGNAHNVNTLYCLTNSIPKSVDG